MNESDPSRVMISVQGDAVEPLTLGVLVTAVCDGTGQL